MNNLYEQFLASLGSPNTVKVARSYKAIAECAQYTEAAVNQTILAMKPKSQKNIITICNIWRRYAEFLGEQQLLQILQKVDSMALWQEAKPMAEAKFMSHTEYMDACRLIDSQWDLLNPMYYKSLLRCLYEGIYSDDMSVLKNLRAADINVNIVTLREDNGNTYQMQIPADLADNLLQLPSEPFLRRNRNATFPITVSGVYHDSCFKVEHRKGSREDAYQFVYYRILRVITKDYMERKNLLPLQIYISGIMHRIGLKLNERGISIEDAFSEHNRDRRVGQIIADELLRCNCNMEVKNFRQMVKGHLDTFCNE